MLSEKELNVYKTIKDFIEKNNYSPTIRELGIILNYKSTKTIHQYLKQLKLKGYIIYIKNKKRSISITSKIKNSVLTINTNKIININIESEQLIYQIEHNYFNKYFIKKNDYIIITITNKLKNNDLGLFIINNKYRIMKYFYNDGFYILEDSTKEILHKVQIIGKVTGIWRTKV